MSKRLVRAATYLTYTEAVDLYQELEQIGVMALVKSCGPPTFPFGNGLYFQLQVQEENLGLAQPVLKEFSEKQAKNRKKLRSCPRCSSEHVQPAQKVTWWQQIIYAGTTILQCQNCHRSFFA